MPGVREIVKALLQLGQTDGGSGSVYVRLHVREDVTSERHDLSNDRAMCAFGPLTPEHQVCT